MSKTITISDDTYDLIKDQISEKEQIDLFCIEDLVGKKWFFRTVTYHMVGRVVKIFGNFIQLENASWVADSGRFMDAVKNGNFNEVEPVGICFINLDSVTDFFPANYDLPKEQK